MAIKVEMGAVAKFKIYSISSFSASQVALGQLG